MSTKTQSQKQRSKVGDNHDNRYRYPFPCVTDRPHGVFNQFQLNTLSGVWFGKCGYDKTAIWVNLLIAVPAGFVGQIRYYTTALHSRTNYIWIIWF